MLRKRENKWYGWRRDAPDYRDISYRVSRVTSLPAMVDMRSACPPVYDQGELGSCTANAVGFLLQWERRKLKLKDFVPSRLMIYYREREVEGTIDSDAGAEIRTGIKVIHKLGSCEEKLWPYDISKFRDEPSASANRKALDDQALQYERVAQTPVTIKRALAAGHPVAFGFSVFENFESEAVEKSGKLDMPRGNYLGGHAVALVGYRMATREYLVRNSWGSDWGMDGYFWMPDAYVCDSHMSSDFWIIKGVG